MDAKTQHPARQLLQIRALMSGGDALIEVGIAVLILFRGHGNVMVLGLILALPWIARLLSHAGSISWIDRVPRKAVLVIGNSAKVLIVIALALMPNIVWDGILFLKPLLAQWSYIL